MLSAILAEKHRADANADLPVLGPLPEPVPSRRNSPAVDAWGSPLAPDLSSKPFDPSDGLGYWHDPDLDLQYVRARWLNPATGQWMSPDPVESEPRYSYAHQMPTTKVDPSGEQGVGLPSPTIQVGPLVLPNDPAGRYGYGLMEKEYQGSGLTSPWTNKKQLKLRPTDWECTGSGC
jgi:RHS repeat-associated protein